MKEKFEDWNPRQDAIELVVTAISIINTYADDGFDLTLRQLYYRIIALDLFPEDRRWQWTGSKWAKDVNGTKNAEPNYKWLGRIIGKARNAGLIDWNMIVDRIRSVDENSHWLSPSEVIQTAANVFAIDKWRKQPYRILVMVEKDALSGILLPVCQALDVQFSINRGYASQTHLYEIAKVMKGWQEQENGKQIPIVLYFGDHDPSGLDMDRDLSKRLSIYSDLNIIEVSRLALTMEQIEEHAPPPNPAKMTDSRAKAYVISYGNESWELDALEPRLLTDLVRNEIELYIDRDLWKVEKAREDNMRAELQKFADDYKG